MANLGYKILKSKTRGHLIKTPCHHVCLNIESDRDDIINERSKPYPITMKRTNRIRLVKNILQNKRILLILTKKRFQSVLV